MSTVLHHVGAAGKFIRNNDTDGPLTRSRKRRTKILYGLVCLIGIVTCVLGSSPFWQATGLGLLLPGGGFLAVGGWAILLFPLTLALFGAALFAWFGSGMIVAPPFVWILAALTAGWMMRHSIWQPSPYIVVALVCTLLIRFETQSRAKRREHLRRRDERNAYLPAALAEAESRASSVSIAGAGGRELDLDAVKALRYCFDRALQPIGQLKGFNKIDQFQTAALRYQLNYLGWTLAQLQSRVTPSFHGYLSLAQRHVIDQYVRRQIWDYWALENLWGNLSLNADPAARDNIMLTGYFGINLSLYMGNTGDMRYAAPGCLEFRLNGRKAFHHDVHSVNRSVVVNFKEQAFCLFPCEPNWIYPPCNFIGLTSLVAYDRVFGTHCAANITEQFRHCLETEFMTPDGSVVPLRSNVTGFGVPFPFDDQMRAYFAAPVLDPLDTRIAWAMGRHDMTESVEGRLRLRLKGGGIDMGWYKPGRASQLATLYRSAREMGDATVAQLAHQMMDEHCKPASADGALSFSDASNAANLMFIQGRISAAGDWRDTIVSGPPAAALRGPILADCKYPEVLVAQACSDGDDLRLVLHPGRDGGPQRILIDRLRPGGSYVAQGSHHCSFQADANGRAELMVPLDGRTALHVMPVH